MTITPNQLSTLLTIPGAAQQLCDVLNSITSSSNNVEVATPERAGVVKQATTVASSTATDVAGLVANYNTLVANLKTAGVIATS